MKEYSEDLWAMFWCIVLAGVVLVVFLLVAHLSNRLDKRTGGELLEQNLGRRIKIDGDTLTIVNFEKGQYVLSNGLLLREEVVIVLGLEE